MPNVTLLKRHYPNTDCARRYLVFRGGCVPIYVLDHLPGTGTLPPMVTNTRRSETHYLRCISEFPTSVRTQLSRNGVGVVIRADCTVSLFASEPVVIAREQPATRRGKGRIKKRERE